MGAILTILGFLCFFGLIVAPFSVIMLIKGAHPIAGPFSVSAIGAPLICGLVALFLSGLARSYDVMLPDLAASLVLLVGVVAGFYIFGDAARNLAAKKEALRKLPE